MSELKPCPFCGHKAELRNSGIETCRNRENGDLITKWSVWCPHCGTERKGGVSEYRFRNDETLCLVNNCFDGRKKAIDAWNRRVGCEAAAEYAKGNRPKDGTWPGEEGEK